MIEALTQSEKAYRTVQSVSGAPRLEFNDLTLATLDKLVTSAKGGLIKRGIEVGGILTGWFDPKREFLRIEGFEKLEIEHCYGPSFRLTYPDERIAKSLVEKLRSAGGSLPIGHFRSHLRDEIEITGDDLVLARAVGGDSSTFVLLIQPSVNSSNLARLYHGRQLLAEFPLRKPVRLLEQVPAAENRLERYRPPHAIRIRFRPSFYIQRRLTAFLPTLRWPAFQAKRLATAGSLILCLSAGVWFLKDYRPSARIGSGYTLPLGLTVQPDPQGVMIQWDPEKIEDGATGRLVIQGSRRRVEMPLNERTVRIGRVFSSSELEQKSTISLELLGPKGNLVSDRVIVVNPVYETPEPLQREPQQPEPDQPAPDRPERKPLEPRRPERNEYTASTRGEQRTTVEVEQPALVRRAFRAVSPVRNGVSALPMMDAPPPSPALLASVPAPSFQNVTFAPPVAAPPPSPRPINFVSVTPIRKVQPIVPLSTRAMLQDDVTIEVRVNIDAGGRVSKASVLNPNRIPAKLLMSESIEAAQQWQFEPARVDGTAVASETTLKFRFARVMR